MSDIESLMKKSRLKLFKQSAGLVFFGIVAYKFQWDVHEMSDGVEGYVQFDIHNSNNTSDGTIHINKKFINNPDYNHNNLIALVIHEILHILNKHGTRRKQRDPKLWNIACDHVVDRDLKEINNNINSPVEPYQNRYNIIQELHDIDNKCSAEKAYDWLKSNSQKLTIDYDPNSNTLKVTDGKGNSWVVNMQNGGISSDEKLSIDEKNKFKNVIDQIVSYSRALNETMKQKSSISGNVSEFIDKLLKVKIPWDRLLEKAIKTNTIMKPDERSWKCLNKYYMPHNITLPGYSFIEDNEGVGLLIITVDTSGSINKKNLQQFSQIIIDSMKYFKEIKLITHDVKVHQIKDFYQDNISEFFQFIKTQGFKGRGGTSHKYCFDKIEELWKENTVKDELSMVISLTDGYSDIEDIYQGYKWIKNNVPLTFTICGDWKYNFNSDNISVINIEN